MIVTDTLARYQVAHRELGRRVGVEGGIVNGEAATSWAASRLAGHCMRVMIELPADADTAIADELLAQIRAVGSLARWCCTVSTTAIGRC